MIPLASSATAKSVNPDGDAQRDVCGPAAAVRIGQPHALIARSCQGMGNSEHQAHHHSYAEGEGIAPSAVTDGSGIGKSEDPDERSNYAGGYRHPA